MIIHRDYRSATESTTCIEISYRVIREAVGSN